MDSLSGKPHIPPPNPPIKGIATVNPCRRLTPLSAPLKLVPLPEPLPNELNRTCAFNSTHKLSVHFLPAAFPRVATPPGQINVPSMEAFSGKDDRKKWIKQTAERLAWEDTESMKMYPDPKAKFKVAEVGLWSTVLRIRRNTRTEDGKGITIIATHPIGFHKEIWEPVFKRLLEITEASSSPIRIDEIWSLDSVSHGDAALINGIHVPKIPDRRDYGRDIANFLIHYLPEGNVAFTKDLPQQLCRLPDIISSARVKNGFTGRQIVAMGHSLGADATVRCALNYPKLFSALILAESTLFPATRERSKAGLNIILSTLGRRSSWPSREEAKKGLLQSPVFRAFDPEAVDVYVQYGMYEDPKTGHVHLKCPPGSEASEFSRARTMNEGFELLPTLDENIEMRWIMGAREDASALVGGPHIAQMIIWRRPKNTTNVLIPGGGHLVVQEKPRVVAKDIALFLRHKYAAERKTEKSRL